MRMAGCPVRSRWMLLPVLVLLAAFTAGCYAPPKGQQLSRTAVLTPDQEDDIGGSFIESGDIRTISAQMTAAILSVPEVAEREDTVRIALAPIKNSTRYVIDKEIFSKRLRLELNRVSEGRIRFFAQGMGQSVRAEIFEEQQEDIWDDVTDQAAKAIVDSPLVKNAASVLHVAVLPVKNVNLAGGINADSLTAMIRAKVAEKAGGRVVFLSREANGKVTEQILDEKDLKDQGLVNRKQMKDLYGVDLFLGGEFIAKSMMAESAKEVTEVTSGPSPDDPGVVQTTSTQTTKKPNVTKYLSLRLIDAETATVPFEKMLKVESKMQSGVGKSDFLLTGELSALSKASLGGNRSDYVLMSFQLVDIASNEIIWEEGYETKRKTEASVIYR